MMQDELIQLPLVQSTPSHNSVAGQVIGDTPRRHGPAAGVRFIRPAVRPPQNSMVRLAVLNALRPASYYSRL